MHANTYWVPENMTQRVWSEALASVLRNTRLHGLIFPLLEITYPQGVTAMYHESLSNKPGRADEMTISSEI